MVREIQEHMLADASSWGHEVMAAATAETTAAAEVRT